jgi:MYXO-CTERM domain-containing protein
MGVRLALSSRASLLRGLCLLLSVVGPLLAAADARADGAFPDSLSILTPEQLPNETLLPTNFGLVMSFDHDQTWIWSCEQALNSFGTLYQVGPAPLNRIYAVSPGGLIYTDDSSCTWTAAAGIPAAAAQDAFVDPTNPNRVLAVVTSSVDAGGSTYTVMESADAGASFAQVRYTAAAGDHITGVEISRSNPQTVYLTLTSGTAYTPKVAVTTNGGANWTLHDLSASLAAGTYSIRLVAVDPTNPQKLVLRTGGGAGEALAISLDGGATASSPLSFPGGVFTAYARLPSGSMIAGGVVGTTDVAYRSVDSGASFQPLPAVPFTFRGMSARGTKLYAALDNAADTYAIETSVDEGMTWQPLMRFDQDIQAIQTCVMAYCQTDCNTRAGTGLFSDDVCQASVMPDPIDAGHDAAASGHDAGGTGSKDASTTTTSSSGGCGHCGLAPGQTASPWSWLVLLAAAITLARRRR